MKPFCSGSRGDARAAAQVQENLLTLDEINPFFFDKPVAPLAAPEQAAKSLGLTQFWAKFAIVAGRCDVLLVEGIGGLMVPLAKNYTCGGLDRGAGMSGSDRLRPTDWGPSITLC